MMMIEKKNDDECEFIILDLFHELLKYSNKYDGISS